MANGAMQSAARASPAPMRPSLYLGYISAISRLYLGYISPAPMRPSISRTRRAPAAPPRGPLPALTARRARLPPFVSLRSPRVGPGQQVFAKQVGRMPLNRTGTRSAADGTSRGGWMCGGRICGGQICGGRLDGRFGAQEGQLQGQVLARLPR